MTWDWQFAWDTVPTLLRGLVITLEASALATLLAMTLGLAIAIIRYLRVPVLSPVLTAFVYFVRGTPVLVQLYFLFYVLPLYGLTLSPLATGVIGLGLHFSTYAAEVYRAGIESVPRGQWDAVNALGLGRWTVWMRVILPQAIRPIGPGLGNYVILMFKESALLSVITVHELLYEGLDVGNLSYRYLEAMTLCGLLYWVISYPSAKLIRRWEGRLAISSH
jgi:polar amino acid transport system permease protein